MYKTFEIGNTINIDDKEYWTIIGIAEDCSDGLRFDIRLNSNEKYILYGCWLWMLIGIA